MKTIITFISTFLIVGFGMVSPIVSMDMNLEGLAQKNHDALKKIIDEKKEKNKEYQKKLIKITKKKDDPSHYYAAWCMTHNRSLEDYKDYLFHREQSISQSIENNKKALEELTPVLEQLDQILKSAEEDSDC